MASTKTHLSWTWQRFLWGVGWIESSDTHQRRQPLEGAGFAVQFVVGPLGEWASALAGHPVKFPQMDLGTMMPLLFGMLGLGAYRTAEKIQGVTR